MGAAPDRARLRLEIGASADYTNELYFEDAFVDTVALGRRLVATPEGRVAGVLFTGVDGTRAGGATTYQLQNELSIGDKVQRDLLGASWRSQPGLDWLFTASPHVEVRRDRTFDRDLEELRVAGNARIRRTFSDAATALELGGGGEVLRTRGQGDAFLLDRNAGTAGMALDHAPLFGLEWRAGYRYTLRFFPDSSERDHWEHAIEARVRRDLVGGHSIQVETEIDRRQTVRLAPTSRDNFWQSWSTLETDARAGDGRGLKIRLDLETMHYDVEDTTLFFNYAIARAFVAPQLPLRHGWTIAIGPRGEALWSPLDPTEEYREIAGMAELELARGGSWWSITPVGGWRSYQGSSSGGRPVFDIPSVHSSYVFCELGLIGDQSLGRWVRLHLFGSGRFESHTDHTQDARSLYFSLDVRRVF